jgi:hypothetical protein
MSEASRADRSSFDVRGVRDVRDVFDVFDAPGKCERGAGTESANAGRASREPRGECAAGMQERLTATPPKFTKFVRRRA